MNYHYPLSDFFRVTGAGGGKSGGGSSDANTMRSKARAKMVEAISEGVIFGLVDEAGNLLSGDEQKKSIFFDQTAIWNADNTENFKNVIMQFQKGLADEGHLTGMNAVETPYSVEVNVRKNTGPTTRTIVDENADAVRVIVRIPSLVRNDTKKGGLKKTSVSYGFEVRSNAGSWTRVVSNSLNDQKTTSAVQIAHRIDLPIGGSPWDIRMVRDTADSETDELQNETYWEGYIVLVEGKFLYPHTAKAAMEVNAEDMGTSIPPRSYRVKGLIVAVPSNYDPVLRTYTGLWDGTFKYAWTNNPAWIFYDLLINDRYGLGEFIKAATVDKWSLYTIARYCDQSIPSGYKNGDTGADIMEPRFTFNGVLNTRDDAYFVLQQISTAWRGMGYWSLGQVFATADMPTDPVRLVTPANVIGGEFSYSGTAIKARHSVVTVTWNDPNDFYRPATEVVIDQAALNKYNWREKRLQLTGCTSRGLAHRYGKWILDTEQNETETIEYSASWDHLEVRPGDIVAVADPRKAQVRLGGRIVSHDGLEVTLDYDFDYLDGVAYDLNLTLPDGSLEKRAIASFLDARTVRLATNFSLQAIPDALFAITGDVQLRNYRVLSVEETAVNVFKVTGLFHDPLKYARVEQNVVFEPIPYSRPNGPVEAPTNLLVKEFGYVSQGASFHTLHLSWTPPTNSINRGFVISVETPDEGTKALGQTMNAWFEMQNTGTGLYTFSVQTIAFTGVLSEPAVFAYEAIGPNGYATPTVSDLRLVSNPASTTFNGRDLAVAWNNNFAASTNPTAEDGTPQHISSPHYSFNTVNVYSASSNALLRSARVVGETFTYTYAMNQADNLALGVSDPQRNLRIEVIVHDVFDRASSPASVVFTNPQPAAMTPSYLVNTGNIYFEWPISTDSDYAGVLIYRSETDGFTPSAETLIHDVSANAQTVVGEPLTTYFFRFAPYDAFGKVGLNFSTQIEITTFSAGADVEPPDNPTGLTLTTRIETIDGIASRMMLTATVGVQLEADFAYFDYDIRQGTGNYISSASATNVYEWAIQPTLAYTVKVRAVDKFGNPSSYTEIATITAPEAPELAAVINAGETLIDPGKIRISGETTLSDWRRGGDVTKIDGGALSANTIDANKLRIGSRGIVVADIDFSVNKTTNVLSWTSGSIGYVNNAGAAVSVAIAAGSVPWNGYVTVYWVQDATAFSFSNDTNGGWLAAAGLADAVPMAVYSAGAGLRVLYGGTIIDGTRIVTGSIQTQQMAADSITATQIVSDAILARHVAANQITADKISVTNLAAISAVLGNVQVTGNLIVDGTLTTNKVQAGAITLISATYLETITTATGGIMAQVSVNVADPAYQVLLFASGKISAVGSNDRNASMLVTKRNGGGGISTTYKTATATQNTNAEVDVMRVDQPGVGSDWRYSIECSIGVGSGLLTELAIIALVVKR